MLCAQYWGKRQPRVVEQIMGISMRLSISIAILFGAAAFLFPGFLMRIFTPDQELIAAGSSYLRVLGLSYLFMRFSQVYLSIMRSIERVVIGAAANVILDPLLIFVFDMGIAGAAVATVISQCCMAVYVV